MGDMAQDYDYDINPRERQRMNQPAPTRPVFGQRPGAHTQTAPRMDFRSAIRKGPTEKPPRIVMIGVEGVGKSTAGAGMPDPIFLCAEDGLVGPQFAETPHYSAASWTDALGFLDWLRTEQHEFKSIVVDTADWLEALAFRHCCERDNKGSIEDYGYGKGYIVAAEEYRRFLQKLDELNKAGLAVLILTHTQIKAFNNPTGENYDRYEPKLAKQISGLLKEWADAVLFARFEVFTEKAKGAMKAKAFGGDNRVVHTTHSAGWDAKNRYGLPEVMPLDMASIIEAIKDGNGAGGESVDNLLAEIRHLNAQLPPEVQAKVEAAITQANGAPATLAVILNKTRNSIEKYAPTTTGESA